MAHICLHDRGCGRMWLGTCSSHSARGYALISTACATSRSSGRSLCMWIRSAHGSQAPAWHFGCVPFDFHISCRLFHGFICTEQEQSRKGQRQDCVHLFFIGSPFYVKERHVPFLFLPVIGPSRRLCRSHGSGRQACRLPGRARRRSSGRCRPRRGRLRSSSCRWSSRRAAAPRCRRPPP